MKKKKFKFDPDLSHFTSKDYEKIYEPCEDSYLFVDGLEQDLLNIISSPNNNNNKSSLQFKNEVKFILEIGTATGFVSCFYINLLKSKHIEHFCFLIDINPIACTSSIKTIEKNGLGKITDVINCNFCYCFIENCFDIILFNPPYVPSEDNELGKNDITASYAGGKNGREVIDKIMPNIKKYLKKNNGVFYMICIEDNNPKEIISLMKSKEFGGFKGEIVKERKTLNEYLFLLKFTR